MNEIRWDLRAIAEKGGLPTVFVRKHRFEVGAPLHFDVDYPHVTALELALGAVAADIAGCLQMLSRQRGVVVENAEVALSAELDNPLTYLGVVGEAGHPGLKHISMTVYVSAEATEAQLQWLWQEALKRSPLVQTLKDAVTLEMRMRVV